MPTSPVGGAIKTAFVECLPNGESRSPVMTSRGGRGIWQRRYWEHTDGGLYPDGWRGGSGNRKRQASGFEIQGRGQAEG
jgi:hypothetical protein